MAGRQHTSLANDVRRAVPVVARFTKDGAATVADLAQRWYNDTNDTLTVQSASVSAGTAPTGAALTVDVKINGTSVFTAAGDRPKIAASANYGTALPTKTGTAIQVPPGGYVTAGVTIIGSTVAGSDIAIAVRLV